MFRGHVRKNTGTVHTVQTVPLLELVVDIEETGRAYKLGVHGVMVANLYLSSRDVVLE